MSSESTDEETLLTEENQPVSYGTNSPASSLMDAPIPVLQPEIRAADEAAIHYLQTLTYTETAAGAVEGVRASVGVSTEDFKKDCERQQRMIDTINTMFARGFQTDHIGTQCEIFSVNMSDGIFEFVTHAHTPVRGVDEPPHDFITTDPENSRLGGFYYRMFCPIPVNLGFLPSVKCEIIHIHGTWPALVSAPHGNMLMPRLRNALDDDVREVIIEDCLITNAFLRSICASNVQALHVRNGFMAEDLDFSVLNCLKVLHLDMVRLSPKFVARIDMRPPNMPMLNDVRLAADRRMILNDQLHCEHMSLGMYEVLGLEKHAIHRLELRFFHEDWHRVLGVFEGHPGRTKVVPLLRRDKHSRAPLSVVKLASRLKESDESEIFWPSHNDVYMTLTSPVRAQMKRLSALKAREMQHVKNEVEAGAQMRMLKYRTDMFLMRTALANLVALLREAETNVLAVNAAAAVALQLMPYAGQPQRPPDGQTPDTFEGAAGFMSAREFIQSDQIKAVIIGIEPEVDLRTCEFIDPSLGSMYLYPGYEEMVEKVSNMVVAVPHPPTMIGSPFNVELADFISEYDRARAAVLPATLLFTRRAMITVPDSGEHVAKKEILQKWAREYFDLCQKDMFPEVDGGCGEFTRCTIS